MYMSADQDLAFVVRAVRVAVYLHDSILTAEFMNRAMEVLGPSLDAYGMVTSLSGLPQSFKVDLVRILTIVKRCTTPLIRDGGVPGKSIHLSPAQNSHDPR